MQQTILTAEQFNALKLKSTTGKHGRMCVDETDINIVLSKPSVERKKVKRIKTPKTDNVPEKGLKKGNKYHAKKTLYKGDEYDSKKEAEYAMQLDDLKTQGKIISWNRQVKMPIEVNGTYCGFYKLDFLVVYDDGHKEYIDIKGYKKSMGYAYFRLKKRIIEAIYCIEITEI